jgi:hypothetical protein
MVEYAPSTGGLALWVQHRRRARCTPWGHAGAAPVTTDGHTCLTARASSAAAAAQTGLVAHEVLHVALRHPQRLLELQQRLGDVDQPLFTTCADAIVNSALGHLSWLQLPQGSVKLDHC